MASRTAKLQAERAETLAAWKALNAKVEAEQDGEPTEEQHATLAAYPDKIKAIDARIAQQEALAEAERTAPATLVGKPAHSVQVDAPRSDYDARHGFHGTGDFFRSVMKNQNAQSTDGVTDERLRGLFVSAADSGVNESAFMLPIAFTPQGLRATAGSDEHSVSDFRYGGALIQTEFRPQVLALGFEGDPTAGRTTMLPMNSLRLELPARVDKTHTSSVTGGLTVGRRAEIEALTSSRMEMERVALTAHSLFGFAYASEEILRFSPISFMAILENGFRDEFPSRLLHEKIRGTGGDQFDGAVSADCLVSVTRTTTNAVKGRDLANMMARCFGYGRAIWLYNQDVIPSLVRAHIPVPSEATPTNIVNVFTPSLSPAVPNMILGRPAFASEYCSTIGSVGDVILADWSQFLEGTVVGGPQSAESIHVRFTNHERAFKFWIMNAGAPWWRSALTPEQSSTTLSPFVAIAA